MDKWMDAIVFFFSKAGFVENMKSQGRWEQDTLPLMLRDTYPLLHLQSSRQWIVWFEKACGSAQKSSSKNESKIIYYHNSEYLCFKFCKTVTDLKSLLRRHRWREGTRPQSTMNKEQSLCMYACMCKHTMFKNSILLTIYIEPGWLS